MKKMATALFICLVGATPLLAPAAAYVKATGAEAHTWRDCRFTKVWRLGCITYQITNPYARTGKNLYKGNTHSHTTNSTDGVNSPVEVMGFYRDNGYDFNAITDHESVTADPAVAGILFISGTEDGLGLYGRDHLAKLGPSVTATDTIEDQSSIDTALAEGDYVQINHPDGSSDWPLAVALDINGQHSAAVWNGVRATEYAGQVDAMLNAGKRLNLAAEEDMHNIALPTAGRQGVRVWASQLTVQDIIAGLKSGNYYSVYAPAGVKDLDIEVKMSGNKVIIRSDRKSSFTWYAGGQAVRTDGDKTLSIYELTGEDGYVRCRVDADGAIAWTNPIFIEAIDYAGRKNQPGKGQAGQAVLFRR